MVFSGRTLLHKPTLVGKIFTRLSIWGINTNSPIHLIFNVLMVTRAGPFPLTIATLAVHLQYTYSIVVVVVVVVVVCSAMAREPTVHLR
jgi:hypothetical protein